MTAMLQQWLEDAFTPPGADWTTFPVAAVAGALLGVGMLVLLLRRGRSAPLPGGEQGLARSPWGRRLTSSVRVAALALPLLALTAALVPGLPSTVALSRPSAAGRLSASERRPTRFGWHRYLDARPPIESALGTLDKMGAGSWYWPDRTAIGQVREVCLAAARSYLEGRPLPVAPVQPLPRWVEESVEITVVRTLALRARAAWVGIDADLQQKNFGWDAERDAYAAAGLLLDLDAPQESDALVVRQLWGGRLDNNTARFWALVSGRAEGGTLHFVVGDRTIPWPLPDDDKLWRLREVELEDVHGAPAQVVAVPSGVATPLIASGRTSEPLFLTLPRSWGDNAALADAFRAAWDELLAEGSDLHRYLVERRGLVVPVLKVQAGPSDDGPNLLLTATHSSVLPAGVTAHQLSSLSAASGPSAPTRILPVGDRGPDTLTALDAPRGGVALAAGSRLAVIAVRPDSPLEAGRFVHGTPQTRPVLSTVAAGGRIATTIHLAPAEQLRPGEEDPSRLRATLAALVVAANDAAPQPAATVRLPQASAEVPRGRCLLTEEELRELGDEAGRPALVTAGAAAVLYFLLLLAHTLAWLRTGHRLPNPS